MVTASTRISRDRVARPRIPKRGFVLLACGERHAERANIALSYLKRATRHDIVVVKARCFTPIECDQIVDCVPPAHFTDVQASVALKTNLHRILGADDYTWCYLDTDVIAVRAEVDRIFDFHRAVITFAKDHVDIDSLSKHVVRCGCRQARCEHLRIHVEQAFDVRISDGRWVPWNGGVFVFGPASASFLDCWHAYAADVLGSPLWYPRDQGALAAAAWKHGLQFSSQLPSRFNRIVDGMRGIAVDLAGRSRLTTSQLAVDRTYHLSRKPRKDSPVLLHFINDTIGRKGWKNWDDVEALAPKPALPAVRRASRLTPDNRIVHGLWIGKHLSKLELLTLQSFIRHGHEFHLWLYGPLDTPLPDEVILENASQIIPANRIVMKRSSDDMTGVGKNSYGPFSDLFRYKLLYERGGYWVDMDVTCLRPFNIRDAYLFRSHRIGVMGNVMKSPRYSQVMGKAYKRTLAAIGRDAEWLFANRILSAEVRKGGLSRFVRKDVCNDDDWGIVSLMLEREIKVPAHWYGIHWINEMHRTMRDTGGRYMGHTVPFIPDKDNPKRGSLLARLYDEYGLANHPKPTPPPERPQKWRPQKPMNREHVNILLPTLNTGGAERIVLDTITALPPQTSARVLILDAARTSFDIPKAFCDRIAFEVLDGLTRYDKLRIAAARVRASPNASIFVHMAEADILSTLHAAGVRTIPVVHNMHPYLNIEPKALNDPGVLFVIGVSQAVVSEQRVRGCRKQIVTIRHEIGPRATAPHNPNARAIIRTRLKIPDGTLLIGMVGQFKTQKNYPRAVKILHRLLRYKPAKLVIVGGWDTNNATGRESYERTRFAATALGLASDVITVGNVVDVPDYLAAFDVFLNTSSHEGLSISMLEAQNAGCRIVASDVGGAREIKCSALHLVPHSSRDDRFVQAILDCLHDNPSSDKAATSDGLIPFLWSALANYGWRAVPPIPAARVFLTTGSALRKVSKMLPSPESGTPVHVGVYGRLPVDFQEFLEQRGVSILCLTAEGSIVQQSACALKLIAASNPAAVYFVGINAELRMVLAKVLSPELVLIDVDHPAVISTMLAKHKAFQHRICMDGSEYYARLHALWKDENAVAEPEVGNARASQSSI